MAGMDESKESILHEMLELRRKLDGIMPSAGTERCGEYWTDPDGNLVYLSPACGRMLGVSSEHGGSESQVLADAVHPGDREKVIAHLHTLHLACEFRLGSDGERWIEHELKPLAGPDGTELGRKAFLLDITNLKARESETLAHLREKEVLLREVQHRIKNNLQIISSLLDLTLRHSTSRQVKEVLSEARLKIHFMSQIHTQLYQRRRFDQIEMIDDIRDLLCNASLIYDKERRITTRVESQSLRLPVSQAVPCALVLCELISNAFKHAFPEGDKGAVIIKAAVSGEGDVSLSVGDDGRGIPDDIDFRKTQSLGLKLIRNLVLNQLGGRLELERDEGTLFLIEFKRLEEGRPHEQGTAR
jgi:two-component sensor histidine kinase